MSNISATQTVIIGAGPSGLLAAKHLTYQNNPSINSEKLQNDFIVLEGKNDVGGLWNIYTQQSKKNDLFYLNNGFKQSSMYASMVGNIPKHFMQFKDFPLSEKYTQNFQFLEQILLNKGGNSFDFDLEQKSINSSKNGQNIKSKNNQQQKYNQQNDTNQIYDSGSQCVEQQQKYRSTCSFDSNISESFLTIKAYCQYLKDYAEYFNLYPYIRFQNYVVSIRLTKNLDLVDYQNWVGKEIFNNEQKIPKNKNFAVFLQNQNQKSQVIFCDFVMACNGHNSIPNIPQIQGSDLYQGKIYHAKEYTEQLCEQFQGKKIAILGVGDSAHDMINKILSHKNPQNLQKCKETQLYIIGKIGSINNNIKYRQYIHENRLYTYEGTINKMKQPKTLIVGQAQIDINDIDCILYCTGYQFSFPFLFKDPKNIINENQNNNNNNDYKKQNNQKDQDNESLENENNDKVNNKSNDNDDIDQKNILNKHYIQQQQYSNKSYNTNSNKIFSDDIQLYKQQQMKKEREYLIDINCKGKYFGPLYKRMFSIKEPNLIFIGNTDLSCLNLFLAERMVQISKLYIQGQLELPSTQDMLEDLKLDQEIYINKNEKNSNGVQNNININYNNNEVDLFNDSENVENYQNLEKFFQLDGGLDHKYYHSLQSLAKQNTNINNSIKINENHWQGLQAVQRQTIEFFKKADLKGLRSFDMDSIYLLESIKDTQEYF